MPEKSAFRLPPSPPCYWLPNYLMSSLTRWSARFPTVCARLGFSDGRRRPLILLGVPVLCGSIWLLFVPMEGADSVYLLLAIAGMYIGTTLVGLPYGAWGAELSPDYHQRARVTAWREQFTLIGLLVAAFIPFLVEQYGEGDTPSIMRGMALAICITTPIAVILLCLFVPETPPSESSDEAKASFTDGVKKVWANKPMRMVVGLILIVTLAEAFRNALSLFFMKSVIQAEGVGTLYFIYFVAGLAAVPGWLWLGRKVGKHVRRWHLPARSSRSPLSRPSICFLQLMIIGFL